MTVLTQLGLIQTATGSHCPLLQSYGGSKKTTTSICLFEAMIWREISDDESEARHEHFATTWEALIKTNFLIRSSNSRRSNWTMWHARSTSLTMRDPCLQICLLLHLAHHSSILHLRTVRLFRRLGPSILRICERLQPG